MRSRPGRGHGAAAKAPPQPFDPGASYAFPVSAAQERIWHADRQRPRNSAYNAAFRWDFRGPLNPEILEQVFNEILRRHEILRATFTELNGTPQQLIAPLLQLRIALTDLRALPGSEREVEMDRICVEEATRGFDLARGPLIRVGLLRMEDERHVLMITAHHIICDGWSIGVIIGEVSKIYAAFAEGRAVPLPDIGIQFPDFVIWQKEQVSDQREQLEYWKNKLDGYRRLEAPTDFPRPDERTTNAGILSVPLRRELADALQSFNVQHGTTMFVTALAVFKTLLKGYVGQNDIAIGSALAGRNRAELEGLVGLFMNEIVLRTDASGDPAFSGFVARVQQTVWEAVSNQDVPFEYVTRTLQSKIGSNPFFLINFNCHRAYGGTATFVLEFAGIRVSTIPSRSQGALYDLNLFMIERQDGWRVSLEYNTDLYRQATAQRLLDGFCKMLDVIASNPERKLSELLLSAGLGPGKHDPANTASAGSHSVTTQLSLHANHGAAAEAYALPASATQERFWLLAKVAPDRSAFNMPASVRIVGPLSLEMLTRSFQFVVDRHEILRTTFKEIDGRFVQHIATELKFSLPVSNLEHVQKDRRDTQLQELLREEARRSFDLERGPLCRARLFRFQADDHVLIITLHHIVSDGWSQRIFQRDLWSIYSALEQDQEPTLPPLAIQYADFTSWQNEWLSSDQASEHLSFWQRQLAAPLPILDIGMQDTARDASTSPGAIETLELPDDLIQRLKSLSQAENATTFMLMLASFTTMLSRYSNQNDVVVGSPSANRMPETEPLIGPFSTPFALRMNLSGNPTLRDVLRRSAKVCLDALEHVDLPFEVIFKQLKLRSIHGRNPLFQFYFVYQTAFLQPQQLRRLMVTPLTALSVGTPFELQLAVIERPDGVRANFDYDPRRFDAATIRGMLRYYEYVLQQFASNPDQPVEGLNPPAGKQSRLAIAANAEAPRAYVAPRDSLEARLATIWEQAFELPRIGICDDFFDLGGQSLLAAQLISRVEKEFNTKIDLSTLLVDRTIEQLAERLRSSPAESQHSNLVPLRPAGTKRPLFCIHGGGGHLLDYREMVAALPADQPVYGLRASDVRDTDEPQTIEQLADKYLEDIRRIQRHGPYQLCGMSFGGLVAYEMATRLADNGEQVRVVALLDTGNGAYYRSLPASRKARFRRTYIVDRLQKYGRNLLKGRFDDFAADANQFVTSRLRALLWKVSRSVCRLLNRPVPRFVRSNLVVFSAAVRDYTPKPYSGRLLLFRAEGRTAEYGDDETLGWTGVARGGVAVHHVPGNHLTIMRNPHVFRLVEQLNQYLAESAN